MTQELAKNSDQQLAPTPKKRDWSGEIELSCWFLPYPVGAHSSSSFVIGSFLTNGVNISGIVEKITLMTSGAVRVAVRVGADPAKPGSGKIMWMVFLEGHGEVR